MDKCTKNETFTKIYSKLCILKNNSFRKFTNLISNWAFLIVFRIDKSELTKDLSKNDLLIRPCTTGVTIRFWFSTPKFRKVQIFSLSWQSVLKTLQFLRKNARQKWRVCPPDKGLQGPSLINFKTTNCEWKTWILSTHTCERH